MTYLRGRRAIPPEKAAVLPFVPADVCIRGYEQYLRQDRALCRATIINYVPFVRDFLKDRFGDRAVHLSCLRAKDVVTFVRGRARRLHVKRAKLMTTALRSFFQYARMRGEITLDLGAAVPIVANWSMTSIPRAIAAEQTQKLLASIDRKSAMGRRDYAILLVLARLGLRAGEVMSLELDDIDWSTGELTVHGKGRRSQLPLTPDVGKAIAAYLRDGRSECASRRIFLRTKAQAAWDPWFDIASSEHGSTRRPSARISFVMDSQATCCAKAHRLPRSARCWVINTSIPLASTRRSI